ncbi:MAG: sensor domain-containing diguanylate cyclase [Thermodesulfovibrionales bacterium]
MKIYSANNTVLTKLLNRNRKDWANAYDVDLALLLGEILTWANKLVPSESGSILLDDPALKWGMRKEDRLYFAACFGKGSSTLVNTFISSRSGIAGETYTTGKPHISRDVVHDKKYYPVIADRIHYRIRSIICAPVVIEGSTIGVIELINRKASKSYSGMDLSLLKIFAGYTATLILNALIAQSFEELSRRDNLTGLYNDRYFFHMLEHEIEKAVELKEPVSLIFFDLDHFKQLNDTHGHLAGSTVLKEIGGILREIFHDTSAISARYGGDEYSIVLPGMGRNEAAHYAEHVRSNIVNNIFLKEKVPGINIPLNIKGLITCSIGVASFPEHIRQRKSSREMADGLIRAADKAMYLAKELGKNRIVVAQRSRAAK